VTAYASTCRSGGGSDGDDSTFDDEATTSLAANATPAKPAAEASPR
jgi:hypothetical protein